MRGTRATACLPHSPGGVPAAPSSGVGHSHSTGQAAKNQESSLPFTNPPPIFFACYTCKALPQAALSRPTLSIRPAAPSCPCQGSGQATGTRRIQPSGMGLQVLFRASSKQSPPRAAPGPSHIQLSPSPAGVPCRLLTEPLQTRDNPSAKVPASHTHKTESSALTQTCHDTTQPTSTWYEPGSKNVFKTPTANRKRVGWADTKGLRGLHCEQGPPTGPAQNAGAGQTLWALGFQAATGQKLTESCLEGGVRSPPLCHTSSSCALAAATAGESGFPPHPARQETPQELQSVLRPGKPKSPKPDSVSDPPQEHSNSLPRREGRSAKDST